MPTEYFFARLSSHDLDFVLGMDPDVHPAEDIHEKLANFRRYVVTVQSIIDDSLEEW